MQPTTIFRMRCFFCVILEICPQLFHLPRKKQGMNVLHLWVSMGTPLKFNIVPENGWLEYYFPIGDAYFQGLC